MSSKFSSRSNETEIMDDLNCSGKVVDQTLVELDVINRWLGGNDVTISAFKSLLRLSNERDQYYIADLGCGSGDMVWSLQRIGRRNGYNCSFVGIDANPNIIAFAKGRRNPDDNITFETMNIFSDDFRNLNIDIAMGTLFFHHFTSEQLILFFKQLYQQVNVGIIINDIHRHWLAYYSIKFLTSIFSKSDMVKFDAPLSVLRAFSKTELLHILREAGINNYKIKWKWAFRWQVIIVK